MVDQKDRQIIAALRQNSRAPIKELASVTKLRPSTVHQRVQKLINDGVIEKFTIKANDAALDESFIVFILVKGTTEKYLSSKMLSDSRIREVYGITGEYDVLVKLKFKDVQDFNDYIIDFRKSNPGIQSTLTMVGTTVLKEEL